MNKSITKNIILLSALGILFVGATQSVSADGIGLGSTSTTPATNGYYNGYLTPPGPAFTPLPLSQSPAPVVSYPAPTPVVAYQSYQSAPSAPFTPLPTSQSTSYPTSQSSTTPKTIKTTTVTTTTVIQPVKALPNETVTSNTSSNLPPVVTNNQSTTGNELTALSIRGSGSFMPSSIWQWLLLTLLILAIVIIARAMTAPRHDAHAVHAH